MQQQLCQSSYLTSCPHILWSPQPSPFPSSLLKLAHTSKQTILWFQHLSSHRIPSQLQLIQLYELQNHTIKKLDKSIFLHESTTKSHQQLNPIKLHTKELLLFRREEERVYVVHIHQGGGEGITTWENKWINFVEEFEEVGERMIYKVVFGYERGGNMVKEGLCQAFVEERVGKVIGLLKGLSLVNIKQVQSQIFNIPPVTHRSSTISLNNPNKYTPSVKDNPSYHEDHLRLPKLTNQQKKLFNKMQQEFPTANDNELCRFLIGKNFNLQEASKLYQKYLIWKQQATKKYTMQSFKEITDKRMFIYCGKDKKGRPVVYNQTSAVIPSQLNEDLYCEFYKYYFEIYIPSKMTGYVDQMVVIANGKGLGFKNFKISLTKRNMGEMLEIAPERQAKLIAVKVNWFGTTVWSILKPLLPTKSVEKIGVYGGNEEEYLAKLEEVMDMAVVPKIVGGENELLNNY